MDGPFLWYLNRSTGFVILALFTLTTALGVLSTGSRGRPTDAELRQPGAAPQRVAAGRALLVVHVVSAVVDSFVDIRWWQAFVPWLGSTYLPLWLGLGTLACDLFLVVTVTSLLRARMQHRFVAGGAPDVLRSPGCCALAHGIGIGTDVQATPSRGPTPSSASCVAVVLGAVGLRLGRLAADRALTRCEPVTPAALAPSPVPIPTDVQVHPGPALLPGIADGPSLAAHRAQYGELPGRRRRRAARGHRAPPAARPRRCGVPLRHQAPRRRRGQATRRRGQPQRGRARQRQGHRAGPHPAPPGPRRGRRHGAGAGRPRPAPGPARRPAGRGHRAGGRAGRAPTTG